MAIDFSAIKENWRSPRFMGVRTMEPIQAGSFLTSIQASATHYCSPRELKDDFTDYQSYEVALMEVKQGKRRESWVNPRLDTRFSQCEWKDRFEDTANGVAGWLDVETINAIHDYLISLDGR